MNRRIFAAILAGAMILSLAACGGGKGGSSSSASASSAAGSSQADGSASASDPDASQPDASQPSGSASSSAGDASQVTITLNKTEVALNKAGATFQLKYTAEPDTDGVASFTSSDAKVAAVAEDGTIKAVAPGKATITVEYDGATATANVTCDWKEGGSNGSKPSDDKPADDKPAGDTSKPAGDPPVSSTAPAPAPSGPVTVSPTTPAPSTPVSPTTPAPAPSTASKVDLSSFYSDTTGKYEFGALSLADSGILDTHYKGLSGIDLEQDQVYYCPMSVNNGEFALVQVKDSKDADAVKKIFQDRINYMAGDGNGPGGAYYPTAMDQWENNSRVVVNGDYVMMIVHENADDIVNEFNALFK